MNPLGIFFGMGAQDQGMGKGLKATAQGVDKVTDAVKKQGKEAGRGLLGKALDAAAGKAQRFSAALFEGAKGFNIASIASSMRDLTGETGNLSNGMESMAVAASKSIRPMIAGMNLTGKEARKLEGRVIGMSYAMGLDATQVGETLRDWAQAPKEAQAALQGLGIGERDLVKITEVTGVKFADFADTLGDLTQGWGVSDANAGQFLNTIVDLGKKTNLGLVPLSNLRANMDTLGGIFEVLPTAIRPTGEALMGLETSALRVGGVFKRMGKDQETATTLGQDTAKMFAEQAVAIQKARLGIEGATMDDSALFKALTQYGVGYTEAQDLITLGSKDALAGMQAIQAVYDRMGTDSGSKIAMQAQLNAALGEGGAGLAYLAMNADRGTAAMAELAKVTATSTTALKDQAKAFSTGFTLQEQLDRAKEGFDTRFRSVGRGSTKKYVGELLKSYRTLGDEMAAMAKDPKVGPLLRKASLASQIGPAAFFMDEKDPGSAGKVAASSAKVQVISNVFEGLQKSMGPIFETLGSAGAFVAPLATMLGPLGPLALAGGGLAAWFALPPDLQTSIVAKVGPILSGLVDKAGDLWFGTDGKQGLGKQIGDALTGAWDRLTAYLDKNWKTISDGINKGVTWFVQRVLPTVARGAASVIGAVIQNTPAIVTALVPMVKNLATTLVAAVPDIVGALVDGMGVIPTALLGIFAAGKMVGIGTSIAGSISGPLVGAFSKGGSATTAILSAFSAAGPIGIGIGLALAAAFAAWKIKGYIDKEAATDERSPTAGLNKQYRQQTNAYGLAALWRAAEGKGTDADRTKIAKMSNVAFSDYTASAGKRRWNTLVGGERFEGNALMLAGRAEFGPTAWDKTMSDEQKAGYVKSLASSLQGAQGIPLFSSAIGNALSFMGTDPEKAGGLLNAVLRTYEENKGKAAAMMEATASSVGAASAKNLANSGFAGMGVASAAGGSYFGAAKPKAATTQSTFVPGKAAGGSTAGAAAFSKADQAKDVADAKARSTKDSLVLLRQIAGYTQRTALVLELTANGGKRALVLGGA